MKLLPKYTFSNNRQIWRIIPGGEGQLIIEERDPSSKEVFFSSIDMNTGAVILDSHQFEEKFWIGIEDVYREVIFFHRYNKPDMPGHSDIIAFDINTRKELWHSDKYLFSLVYDNHVYCYRNEFEGRKYFKLNYITGELVSNLGDDIKLISELKELRNEETYKGYTFPNILSQSNKEIIETFEELRKNESLTDKIDFVIKNNLLLTSYHRIISEGKFQNCFKALDIRQKKIIFEEILNKEIINLIPDSFFLINDLIFLLKEKEKLIVFLITD
jgi:hypothetical protein